MPARRHGLSKSPEFNIWWMMHQRCKNAKAPNYHNYGGRGIYVDSQWDSLEQFVADMGFRPSPKHQLDRIDNDGPYSKDNCRWATRSENNLNTRRNNRLGEIVGAKRIAEYLGISIRTYYRRKAEGAV